MGADSKIASSEEIAAVIANYASIDSTERLGKYAIQNLVAQPRVMNYLARQLSLKAKDGWCDIVAGNVSGGMVPSWQLRQYLEDMHAQEVLPYIYVREGYKKGGHGELEVGTRNNPMIRPDMNVLLVDVEEDAAKFDERVSNSVDGLQDAGYNVTHVATIVAPKPQLDIDVDYLYLTTLPELLEAARANSRRELEEEETRPHAPYSKAALGDIGMKIIDGGALEIRDVDHGEEPFLYRSGNKGPGYLMIKGLVGQPAIMKYLVQQLAIRLLENGDNIDGIAANATGGVIPGWQLREELETLTGKKEIPYVCVTGTRVNLDEVNPREMIIGLNNPNIRPGMNLLVIEELVNFAETTTMSAKLLRKAGFNVSRAATLFTYDHKEQRAKLTDNGVNLTHLITLKEQLDVAEARYRKELVDTYREFLDDPRKWQLDRGIVPPAK